MSEVPSSACIGRPPRPVAERFWKKVRRGATDECWPWLACLYVSGYGQFDGRPAHRQAYELTHGPIPSGLCVLHACDVKQCVNPNHLWLGTIQDNHDDMWRKGRARPPVGENHGMAKVQERDVLTLRRRRRDGEPVVALAHEFGLSRSHTYAILQGKRWASVSGGICA